MDEDDIWDRHTLSCSVWLSDDPCSCGADDGFPLLRAEPGTTAHHLNQLGEKAS